MSADRVGAERSPYFAGPGRRVIVILDLADLRGPARGVVELPLRVFWYPDRTFDLDQPRALQEMYETVLRDASRPADLAGLLNGQLLVALWPHLHLPRGVRQAWEQRHPVLREAAGSAPDAGPR
jgi:hypothetical protein